MVVSLYYRVNLSVIPVSSSRADHPSASAQYERRYFPQIADGSQGDLTVTTRLLFFNAGSDSTVLLQFYHSDGAAMEVDLADKGRVSEFEFLLYVQSAACAAALQMGPHTTRKSKISSHLSVKY